MISNKKHLGRSPGFALLVVLSTLAILTLLFAVSTRLSLAHLRHQTTEHFLAEKSARNLELLDQAARRFDFAAPERDITITYNETDYVVRMINAGGLVDLNTAKAALWTAYLEEIGFDPANRETLLTWRESGQRFERITDVLRISGATDIDVGVLAQTATVVSGRTGVSRDLAPTLLVDLLRPSWQDDWANRSPSSNYELFVLGEADSRRLGTINTSPDRSVHVFKSD